MAASGALAAVGEARPDTRPQESCGGPVAPAARTPRPTPAPGPWGTPGGQSPPGTLGATGEGLDSCKDSESSC